MFIHAPIARSRSLTKALTWRMVGSIDTFMVSFVVATLFHQKAGHAATIAGSIAMTETVTKIILFYVHERLWARVPWGRADKVVEFEHETPAPQAVV